MKQGQCDTGAGDCVVWSSSDCRNSFRESKKFHSVLGTLSSVKIWRWVMPVTTSHLECWH